MPKTIKEETLQDLAIRRCDSFGNWEIYYPGRGQVPAKCRGKFTTPTDAQRFLETYLANQGIVNEARKAREEVKSITELDHLYDDVED